MNYDTWKSTDSSDELPEDDDEEGEPTLVTHDDEREDFARGT